MTTFAFAVTVSGLELDDYETLDLLVLSADFVLVPSEDDGVCTLDVEIDAISGERALEIFTAHVSSFPAITIDRVSEDLVNTSEIASRLDVNRETVRMWVKGERGLAGFPKHRVVVGGQKIWAWSTIYAWATVTRSIPNDIPRPIDVSCIDWFNGTHKLTPASQAVQSEDRSESFAIELIQTGFISTRTARMGNWLEMFTTRPREWRFELETFRPNLSEHTVPAYESREGGTYTQTIARTIKRAG